MIESRRKRQRRYRRHQTPTAHLVSVLHDIAGKLQKLSVPAVPVAATVDDATSKSDAAVQCNLLGAPPLGSIPQPIARVTGIQKPYGFWGSTIFTPRGIQAQAELLTTWTLPDWIQATALAEVTQQMHDLTVQSMSVDQPLAELDLPSLNVNFDNDDDDDESLETVS